jgi:hypothetical protein
MPTKLPKSVARIPIPLYGGSLWVAQSIADTNICASLIGGETDIEGWEGLSYPLLSYRGHPVYLVGLKRPAVDVLAHELSHVTFKILHGAGVAVSPKDDEAFCYLMQYLMAKALPYLYSKA